MTPNLPGSIPGLLRRCSPVVLRFGEGIPEHKAVISEIVGDVAHLGHGWTNDLAGLSLDLTDPTGRAHAAWWLMGVAYGGISPLQEIRSAFSDASGVVLMGWPQNSGWASVRLAGHHYGDLAPSLQGLDPHDPRLLPDGSRWVDAEALRRACLHVAGLTP